MPWFLYALVNPVLNATVNHVDKYLIERYLKGGAIGALIIFSSIFSIVALPIILFIHPGALQVGLSDGIILILNDMLIVVANLCYFYALEDDEASIVVPFYQMIPIFGFVLGFFILGETITAGEGIGALIVILGAVVLSIRLTKDTFSFRKKVALLMLLASFLYGINGVIFKFIALDTGFWTAAFWGFVGKVLLGLAFLACIPSYRRQFIELARRNSLPVIGLTSLSEALFMLGETSMNYALLLAPVALVLLVSAFQPVFVLIFGIALALLFPKLVGRESLARSDLIQKTFGIALVLGGTYLITIL